MERSRSGSGTRVLVLALALGAVAMAPAAVMHAKSADDSNAVTVQQAPPAPSGPVYQLEAPTVMDSTVYLRTTPPRAVLVQDTAVRIASQVAHVSPTQAQVPRRHRPSRLRATVVNPFAHSAATALAIGQSSTNRLTGATYHLRR